MRRTLGLKTWKVILSAVLLAAGLQTGTVLPQEAEAAPTVVTLNGATVGRTYEGVGAVFSNGMTKLLMDYPAAQRADILDLLFKPKFGASLQHVKVEIGTDVNSSAGTEPSHMRSATDFDITRGSNLWLAAEAKAINPSIELEALRWGTPRWLLGPTGTVADHAKTYNYYLKFLEGARDVYGLRFDYLGVDKNEDTLQSEWNPTYNPSSSPTNGRARDYVVNVLRPGLDADGFADVGLVAADSNTGWWIADKVVADSGLANALDVLNIHYNQSATSSSLGSGKRLWAGEDLAPIRYDFVGGSLDMAYRIMRMYTDGRMTKYEMHPAIESAYPTTPFNTKSILVAQTPWSGFYEILKGLWVTAHFTQFTEIGWQYIDSGNVLNQHGGYTLLKSPTSGDWSLIVLNQSATPREYTFQLTGGLSTGTVHAWKTTDAEQFVQQASIAPSGGTFTVQIEPFSIYTFTTTTGQQKGTPAHAIPASTSFPLTTPYHDNFNGYEIGKMPKYTSDQGGAFEIVPDGPGKSLEQVINAATRPVDWKYRTTPDPYTLLGSVDWRNFEVEADIKYTDSDTTGYTLIGGRVAHNLKTETAFDPSPAGGYNLKIDYGGAWQLRAAERVIASGTLPGYTATNWNKFRMRFAGTNIKVFWNSSATPFVDVHDTEFASGQVQLGSGYNKARFDNLTIRRIDAATAVDVKRHDDKAEGLIFRGAWESMDGNYDTHLRTTVGSRTAGDTLEFKFNGTAAIVTGTLDRDGGLANVYIDGVLAGTIDAYSPSRQYRRAIFTASGLAPGEHTLKLEVLGARSPGSIDNYVRVDTVEIGGGTNELLSFEGDYFYDTFRDDVSNAPPRDWLVFAAPGTSANVHTDGTGKKWLRLEDTVSAAVPAANRAVLDRKFAPVSGSFVWEFEYMTPAPGSWVRIALSNNGTDGIQLFDTNTPDGLAYIRSDDSRGKIADLVPGATHRIRIEANTATATFSAYVDDVLRVSGVPFKHAVPHFDRIHIETPGTNASTLTAYLDNIRLAGKARSLITTVRDVFDEFPNGTQARGYRETVPANLQMLNWRMEKTSPVSADGCSVSPTPSAANKSFACVDSSNAGNVVALRGFPRQYSGLVTVEFSFMQNATGRWTRLFLGNGTEPAIELYDTSDHGLAFKADPHTDTYLSLGAIQPNTWHKVRIVVDMDDRTFDAYLDGTAKLRDQPFTNPERTALNQLRFRTADSTTVQLYIDDVKVTVD